MEFTASSLAAELKRQVDSKLPSTSFAAGGLNKLAMRASISAGVSTDIYFKAIGLLLEQLADELPEWEIGLEGDPDDLEITFSR